MKEAWVGGRGGGGGGKGETQYGKGAGCGKDASLYPGVVSLKREEYLHGGGTKRRLNGCWGLKAGGGKIQIGKGEGSLRGGQSGGELQELKLRQGKR